MGIGRTGEALGLDAGVDGLGEGAVFDDAGGTAGVIVEAFAFAGGLYAAIDHAKDEAIGGFFDDFLCVDGGIETIL